MPFLAHSQSWPISNLGTTRPSPVRATRCAPTLSQPASPMQAGIANHHRRSAPVYIDVAACAFVRRKHGSIPVLKECYDRRVESASRDWIVVRRAVAPRRLFVAATRGGCGCVRDRAARRCPGVVARPDTSRPVNGSACCRPRAFGGRRGLARSCRVRDQLDGNWSYDRTASGIDGGSGGGQLVGDRTWVGAPLWGDDHHPAAGSAAGGPSGIIGGSWGPVLRVPRLPGLPDSDRRPR